MEIFNGDFPVVVHFSVSSLLALSVPSELLGGKPWQQPF